jgi:hypothetical protein
MANSNKLLLTVLEPKPVEKYTKSQKNILKLVINNNTLQHSLSSAIAEDNDTTKSSSSEDFELVGDTIISVTPNNYVHNDYVCNE